MNSRQKEVIQEQLNREKELLRDLRLVYGQAQDDTVNKVLDLSRRKDMENIQTIIYQKQYQDVLRTQIDAALDKLQDESYNTIQEYLEDCYSNGYIGAMYDIAGQGVPLIVPIDHEAVVKAIQIDSKLSTKKVHKDAEGKNVALYEKMGEDINDLKQTIRMEVSRGVLNGSSWNDIGQEIANSMKSTTKGFGFNKALNNATRIARTEGHRIQNQSTYDAQVAAKKKGADVVKQWDATLDGATRDTHRLLDGQIREIDEDFEVQGESAPYPGGFGDPAEDCNCRCALLQRARWAIGDDEHFTKWDSVNNELLELNSNNYEQFKEAYQDMVDNNQSINQITNNLYEEAKNNEPQITSDMKNIIDNAANGTIDYNLGKDTTTLDYRLKTEESIKRKVTSDFTDGKKLSDIEKETYDCVRYTDTVVGSYLVGDYYKINQELENKGYKTVRVKNTFVNENVPYRGVNTVVESPSGYKFELQYHTPESIEVKEKNHLLYEQQRRNNITIDEYLRLGDEMVDNSNTLAMILGVESIESFDDL